MRCLLAEGKNICVQNFPKQYKVFKMFETSPSAILRRIYTSHAIDVSVYLLSAHIRNVGLNLYLPSLVESCRTK